MKYRLIRDIGIDLPLDNYQQSNVIDTTAFGHKITVNKVTPAVFSPHDRIAVIIEDCGNMWARRVAKGYVSRFSNALLPGHQPSFDFFSAERSVEALSDIVSNKLGSQNHYRAVVTIGCWVSKHIADLCQEYAVTTPHIFLGVRDPIELGLVTQLENSGKEIAGAISTADDQAWQVRMLTLIKDTIKKVVVPYTQTNVCLRATQEQIDKLRVLFERIDICVEPLCITADRPLEEQLHGILEQFDVVWLLRDAYIQAHTKKLIKLCNAADTTIFATDLAAVFQGAALGCGSSGTILGAYGAHMTLAHFVNGTPLSELATCIVDPVPVLRINPKVIGTQGLELSADKIALLQDVIPLGWE